jgi:hypothetical protein
VTVQYATSFGSAIADRDYTPASGTLTFAPNITQQSFTIQTIDNQKYSGERGVLVGLSNPTGGAALGIPPIARLDILDNESFDPTLLDDFETYPYLWRVDKKGTLSNPEIAANNALALPGQGAYEHILQVGQKSGAGTYAFSRTFPIGQDWSGVSGLNFWYYGILGSAWITIWRLSAILRAGSWFGAMSSTAEPAQHPMRAYGAGKWVTAR